MFWPAAKCPSKIEKNHVDLESVDTRVEHVGCLIMMLALMMTIRIDIYTFICELPSLLSVDYANLNPCPQGNILRTGDQGTSSFGAMEVLLDIRKFPNHEKWNLSTISLFPVSTIYSETSIKWTSN